MRKLFVGLAALAGLLLLAFLLLRTPDVPWDELRADYASPASQFIELAPGFRVHVRDEGPREAPVLLLVHGSNASLHSWELWVARLSDRFRIVSLDLQGHGLTGPAPDGCYTPDCMATTIEAVRAKLGIERLAIAGNSMGGNVALSYALAHPERVTHLILVDSSGAPVKADRPAPLGFRIARMPVVRDIAAHVTPRSVIERTLDQSVSVKAVATEAAVDRYWRLLRAPGNREATMARFSQAVPQRTAADLAPLRGKLVLILWGEEDALIPVAAALWFKAALPGARLVSYPGIGHLPQEEAPDRTAADVAAFLAQPPE
ncbi:MAG: alpha/beta fold hydrolase [Sphingomonadaceae bacterium]